VGARLTADHRVDAPGTIKPHSDASLADRSTISITSSLFTIVPNSLLGSVRSQSGAARVARPSDHRLLKWFVSRSTRGTHRLLSECGTRKRLHSVRML
jgi:hypothetical protein